MVSNSQTFVLDQVGLYFKRIFQMAKNQQIDYINNIQIGLFLEQHHFPSNSSATLGTGSKDHAPTTSRCGMIGGSIKSLPSQDSIGTSSSICGDNVSITSSTRRTSGSFNSASRQRYNQHLGARHVTKSSNNALTSKTGGASETKRSSISSAQSQGKFDRSKAAVYHK